MKMKKSLPLWLSFLIPLCITGGICILRGMYPFGDQCMLHIDMYHQYAPFFTEFMNQLKEGGSLAYTWNLGLGTDMVSLMAYYFASPVNWLLVFCPQNFVIEFMSILILLKISAAGLTFCYYLRRHYEDWGFLPVLFSVFYALSGFVCAYYWDIMWLDAVWLAPLIILGLERLVKQGKCGLYFGTLALAIFSNYYIAIMICIFLVLYFVILMVEQPMGHLKAMLRFGVYSLLAGGCAAVMVLPEIALLSNSGSGGIDFPETVEWYFNLLDELARACIGTQVIATTGHWPNLYCGVAVLPLFFLFLLNGKIPRKRRICFLLLAGFFLLSFAQNQLNFIWHGFHFPDGLPARQTFLYAFLMLLASYEAVHAGAGVKLWNVCVSVALAEGLLVLCYFFTDTELVTPACMVLSAAVILGYGALLIMRKGDDLWFRQMSVIFAFALVCVEAAVNVNITSMDSTSRSSYTENWQSYRVLAEEVAEGDDFSRIETFTRLTKNESALNNYPSASVFSSLINVDVATAYRELGMEGGKNYYCYNGATMLTSAMLDVGYLMTDSACEESPYRRLMDSSDGIYLYENLYTLPLGFVLGKQVTEQWDYAEGSSIDAQNRLAYALGATEDLLVPADTEVTVEKTVIHVEEDGYYYGYYTGKDVNSITAVVGQRTRKFSKCAHVYLLDLGYCYEGQDITLSSTESSMLQIQGYRMDEEAFATAYQTLAEQTMVPDSCTDTTVRGHIQVAEAGSLCFSIPDDEGWQVYVDGEKVPVESFCNAFLSVPLEEGCHEIRLEYHTPNLWLGILVSGLSLLVGIGSLLAEGIFRKHL
ncbi:MAG: YfhO family protein [Roseburia sp.]